MSDPWNEDHVDRVAEIHARYTSALQQLDSEHMARQEQLYGVAQGLLVLAIGGPIVCAVVALSIVWGLG